MKKFISIAAALLLLGINAFATPFCEGQPTISIDGRTAVYGSGAKPVANTGKGVVSVRIYVDPTGSVKRSEVVENSSTIKAQNVWTKCTEAAKTIKFNPDVLAYEDKVGYVVYEFSPKDIEAAPAPKRPDAITFMGVPVDGSVEDFMFLLGTKGYTVINQERKTMRGRLNGSDVTIAIRDYRGKVWAVGVAYDERDAYNAHKLYNHLLESFKNLDNRYFGGAANNYLVYRDYTEDEERKYTAVFYTKEPKKRVNDCNADAMAKSAGKVTFRMAGNSVLMTYENRLNRPDGQEL